MGFRGEVVCTTQFSYRGPLSLVSGFGALNQREKYLLHLELASNRMKGKCVEIIQNNFYPKYEQKERRRAGEHSDT